MSLSAAHIAFLQENRETIEKVTTVDFMFRDEAYYVSSSVTPRTIGGRSYQGLGGVLSATGITREGGFKASAVTYRLHATTGPLTLAIDTDKAQYKNLPCIRRVQYYAAGVPVGDPIVKHNGFMNSAKWRVSNSEDYAEIVVRDRRSRKIAPPRFYTDTGQRARHADDAAFQYMATISRGGNLSGWLFG